MSLAAACGWTLLRSAIVAAAGVPICWCLRRQLAALAPRPRLLLWILLLIPFFTPAILTGYGWSNFALSLVRHPFWNEVLYATLLALRFIPAGLMLMWLAPPPPLTAEALHTARLAAIRRGRLTRWVWLSSFAWRGSLRDALPAWAVIFLLAFQEFETASLMGAASWTVWLFDAQAGGLLLSETLRRALWPLACEAAVLVALVTFLVRGRFLTAAPDRRAVAWSAGSQAAAWLFALSASVAVAGVPLVLAGGDLAEGFGVVLRSRRVVEETGVALAYGAISGAAAAGLVAALLHRNGRRGMLRVVRAAGVVLLLPGLLGSLAVSLGVLWLFQRDPLRAAYDSPLPVLMALGLFLLPRAAVLFLLVGAATPRHGLHTARLLAAAADSGRRRAARWLTWQLGVRRYVLAAGVVSVWGYLELLPASILSPAGMRSAVVRLYEDMHYGRNAVLSSTALLVIVAPGLLWLVLASLAAGATWCLGRFRGR